MKYINEQKIFDILEKAGGVDAERVREILAKSRRLERLTLHETAALLLVNDPDLLNDIFSTAAYVKNEIYGKRIVLFAPLYISNVCSNKCSYCAFQSGNNSISRKILSYDETRLETEWLLKRGHKRILLVAGECSKAPVDYYVESIRTIYAASFGPHKIRRVNINCAPLSVGEFKKLKSAGIGTYQIFQETYHEGTYRRVHLDGPKSDPDNRISAVDRAIEAGIDDVGIGVLYGLYDYRFDTMALLTHIEHLEAKFNIGPHTISVPRIEPAVGVDFKSDHFVSDADFKKVVAVLRLAVPYTGIILSTRENPVMRDTLFDLGVSQISAESKTSPGGYTAMAGVDNKEATQFCLSDHRTLDEVIRSLITHGYIPSFCAACYRSERTGEAFMNLAKPGLIKGKCAINALITLREYLDDFASDSVKHDGYKFIDRLTHGLDAHNRTELKNYFSRIEKGCRDEYV